MNKEKNFSIELLRIISMLGVVGTHVINNLGIASSLSFMSIKYLSFSIIEIFTRLGVGIFILITGYLMVGKEFKLNRLIGIMFQLLFYSLFSLIISLLFFQETITIKLTIKTIFPFLFGNYWYLIAYITLCLLGPMFNIMLDALCKRTYLKMLIIGFVLFSIIPTFTTRDIFILADGHSALWMFTFYSVGYYLKKYEIIGKLSNKLLILTFSLCYLLSFLGNSVVSILQKIFFDKELFIATTYFNAYTSPTIILATICFFLWVMNQPIKLTRALRFLSTHAFAVYLIHASPIWMQGVFKDSLAGLSAYSLPIMLVCFFLITSGIYLVCSLIDALRVWLVKRLNLTRVNEHVTEMIENGLQWIVDRIAII